MQWWCFAQQGAWEGTWQAYPGVWLFVLGLAVLRERLEAAGHPGGSVAENPRRRRAFYYSGLLLLWAGLDWPLGPLGASYLASVHTIQFLLIGVSAPALMLLGLPPGVYDRLSHRPRLLAGVEAITHPLVAFCVFNGVMTATHWPSVVDSFMSTQIGAFGLDVAWVAAGLVFWWPVIAPVPARPGFHPLLKIGYLALNGFLIRPPTAIMIFAAHPAYAIYELAPPIGTTDPLRDQQLAGVYMKVGTAWLMGIAVAVTFYLWYRAEQEKTG